MKKVRCAIYTRKSSEEGLEQDFNSLHAQREACAAYVLSQASEGWSLLPGDYDDGGLSGGTLERPALQRLLAEIAAGRIDIVVVYKVDRLTRSLLDFSRLVEAFDKADVSFVSVTQSFNTTTSMGRLTLNMLLSFAQFEREVTAERIRDKIAASKARGMWMGGTTPLGYRPDRRTLAIVDEHAALVRAIFARYLACGNVRELACELEDEGIRVPQRTASTGRAMGGGVFSRGQLYKILSNPILLGEIHHKGQVYQGKHPAIIDRKTWDQVQTTLADNRQGVQPATHVRSPSLLAGKIVDEAGEPLVAAHANKGKVRYRYYVSRSLHHAPGSAPGTGLRIPAGEIEAAVIARVGEALDDPLALLGLAGIAPEPGQVLALVDQASKLSERIRAREVALVRSLVAQIHALPRELRIELCLRKLAQALAIELPAGSPAILTLTSEVRLTRTGRAVRLIHRDGKAASATTPDPALVRLLIQARGWWGRLAEAGIDVTKLASQEGVTRSYVSRVVRLNFLAPKLVEAILAGTQPPSLTATRLKQGDLPCEWVRQAEMYLAG